MAATPVNASSCSSRWQTMGFRFISMLRSTMLRSNKTHHTHLCQHLWISLDIYGVFSSTNSRISDISRITSTAGLNGRLAGLRIGFGDTPFSDDVVASWPGHNFFPRQNENVLEIVGFLLFFWIPPLFFRGLFNARNIILSLSKPWDQWGW